MPGEKPGEALPSGNLTGKNNKEHRPQFAVLQNFGSDKGKEMFQIQGNASRPSLTSHSGNEWGTKQG